MEELWVFTLLHGANAFANDAAEHHHATVCRTQVLQGMHGDRTLPHLGVIVSGYPLPLLVGPIAVLPESLARERVLLSVDSVLLFLSDRFVDVTEPKIHRAG